MIAMYGLTEQQRTDAIKSCERIQELCAQQQRSMETILKIFDNLAKGKEPREGLKD